MNEQKNNGRGIFYGVIGVATLVVAIIGATFAYFTATASNNNVITGNMATIQFGLNVAKVTHVDETKGGMIPMSNTMVEAAVLDTGTGNAAKTCVDANGNAVCQIYKITVTNTGTASLFLDGYVSLTGGSGTPTDAGSAGTVQNKTTMRWAQVFCTGGQTDEITGCTTVGKSTTGATSTTTTGQAEAVTSGITEDWASLANKTSGSHHNNDNIKTAGVTAKGAISGNPYDIINMNYIRISDHAAGASYDRTADVTSALVFNQYLDAAGNTADEQEFYIVVWLSETGTDQTVGSGLANVPTKEETGLGFFSGNVTFNSAQGSEVTATFSGYTAVPSQQPQTPQQPSGD